MIKSEKPKKTKKIESKITVIKIGNDHIKILQRGDKVVVRQGAGILFNNLKNKQNFDKWWEETVEAINKTTTMDVIKSEVVDNKAMTAIHAKYKY